MRQLHRHIYDFATVQTVQVSDMPDGGAIDISDTESPVEWRRATSTNVELVGRHKFALAGIHVLYVYFNNGSVYQYQFRSENARDSVFFDMAASQHAWSEVGYPRLVLGRVPYSKLFANALVVE